jgi:hypothetical protein
MLQFPESSGDDDGSVIEFPREAPDTPKRQNRGRWKRGQTGNPAGRPKALASRSKASIRAALIAAEPTAVRKLVAAVRKGDMVAIRLLLSLTFSRDRCVVIDDVPRVRTAADALTALARILEAATDGRISPAEGAALSALAKGYVDVAAAERVEERLMALEARLAERRE